jgi:putative ATPase
MEPLATRLRPVSLNDYSGQAHLVGEGKPLRIAIEEKKLFSFILWGPPGVGKTTLARIYAEAVGADFYELSAVSAGKAEVRDIIERPTNGKPKILFLDEIHRFNKAQQDFLLPFVENGAIVLIGATTENPSFEVISALLSRCRVFVLESLAEAEIEQILRKSGVNVSPDAIAWISAYADGDARKALGVLEQTHELYGTVSVEHLANAVQSKHLRYDQKGDEHYNTVSAFIKSMRASQVDSALYYLARMISAGEDPLFIARRMVIFASEDVGMALPTALVVANEVFRSCEIIGLPECSITLAHGVVYLASAPKDRSAYSALRSAEADVAKTGALKIPLHIRNAPTKLMKKSGYGEGYLMYTNDDMRPSALHAHTYYTPQPREHKGRPDQVQ